MCLAVFDQSTVVFDQPLTNLENRQRPKLDEQAYIQRRTREYQAALAHVQKEKSLTYTDLVNSRRFIPRDRAGSTETVGKRIVNPEIAMLQNKRKGRNAVVNAVFMTLLVAIGVMVGKVYGKKKAT